MPNFLLCDSPDFSECLPLILSKILGICILIGAFFVRIPQIYCIIKTKSVQGINDVMYYLENISCIISAAYGFRMMIPFTTYGENYFLLVQNSIILAQIYYYERRFIFPLAIFCSLWFALFFEIIPLSVLTWTVIFIPIPLNILSRLPQIWQLYHEKSAGSVSLFMNFANTCGSLVRIFNIVAESFDIYMLTGYIVSFTLHVIITTQITYYKYYDSDNNNAKKNILILFLS